MYYESDTRLWLFQFNEVPISAVIESALVCFEGFSYFADQGFVKTALVEKDPDFWSFNFLGFFIRGTIELKPLGPGPIWLANAFGFWAANLLYFPDRPTKALFAGSIPIQKSR